MLCLWPVHIISIYSRFSHVYVCMCVWLYTHAYIRMHRYMHMHAYTCSVSWEISVWFINFIHVLDYPIFFYVLWRSLCLYHVYFKRWYVLCIHKPELKHDVLPYIYVFIYICVCVCIFFITWCAAMFLWRSRIIAVSANVFFCCLYPTINKVYLILYLILICVMLHLATNSNLCTHSSCIRFSFSCRFCYKLFSFRYQRPCECFKAIVVAAISNDNNIVKTHVFNNWCASGVGQQNAACCGDLQ